MGSSKTGKAYNTVGSWGCSKKVVKMSTAGKAYTTVGSEWRKADYGLEFQVLHHVFHRNVQLYFQRRGCSNQAANMRLRYEKEQISFLNPL